MIWYGSILTKNYIDNTATARVSALVFLLS